MLCYVDKISVFLPISILQTSEWFKFIILSHIYISLILADQQQNFFKSSIVHKTNRKITWQMTTTLLINFSGDLHRFFWKIPNIFLIEKYPYFLYINIYKWIIIVKSLFNWNKKLKYCVNEGIYKSDYLPFNGYSKWMQLIR